MPDAYERLTVRLTSPKQKLSYELTSGVQPPSSMIIALHKSLTTTARSCTVPSRHSTMLLTTLVVSLVAWSATTTLLDSRDGDGYYYDSLGNVSQVAATETLQCPSNDVITSRFKCQKDGEWVDCFRNHCCPEYNFVAGKCLSKDVDPCSLGLCEQRCTVFLQRVICTCYSGFKFNPENQKRGLKPVCEDVNECLEDNGDCEHECVNERGDHRCACRHGYQLRTDNRTCEPLAVTSEDGRMESNQAASKERCYANCDTVLRLHNKVSGLQEKLLALSTAVRLSSVASGSPGPAGKPGPPGPPGPRGFPGTEGPLSESMTSVSDSDDFTYSLLDSYVTQDSAGQGFCRCKRGPMGPPGAVGKEGPKGTTGEKGPRGPKGNPGSFDFLLLLLADIRHDIRSLQLKVFNDEDPPPFDLHGTLKDHRRKERKRLEKQALSSRGHTPPPAEKRKWQTILQDPEEFKDLSLSILADYEDDLETSGEIPVDLS